MIMKMMMVQNSNNSYCSLRDVCSLREQSSPIQLNCTIIIITNPIIYIRKKPQLLILTLDFKLEHYWYKCYT